MFLKALAVNKNFAVYLYITKTNVILDCNHNISSSYVNTFVVLWCCCSDIKKCILCGQDYTYFPKEYKFVMICESLSF